MNTTYVLDKNIPVILINWSKDFVRKDHTDLEGFIWSRAMDYATLPGVDKSLTKEQIKETLIVAFRSPINILTRYKARQKAIGQFKDHIEEIDKALAYYN